MIVCDVDLVGVFVVAGDVELSREPLKFCWCAESDAGRSEC